MIARILVAGLAVGLWAGGATAQNGPPGVGAGSAPQLPDWWSSGPGRGTETGTNSTQLVRPARPRKCVR